MASSATEPGSASRPAVGGVKGLAHDLMRFLGVDPLSLECGLRVGGIVASTIVFVVLLVHTQAFAAMAVTAALILIQIALLCIRVRQAADGAVLTLEAVAAGDLAAGGKLAADLPRIQASLERLRRDRAASEARAAADRTLIEHAPVALLALEADGRAVLLNDAARRLFKDGAWGKETAPDRPGDYAEDGTGDGTGDPAGDFENRHGSAKLKHAPYGEAFHAALTGMAPGEAKVVRMLRDGVERRVKLTVRDIVDRTGAPETGEDPTIRRLVAVENIQGELDATELTAWHDLVRVLTHEMMNSLTPVASLAETADGMLEDLAHRVKETSRHEGEGEAPPVESDIAEIRTGLEAIKRRSAGLMHFIDSYRKFTRMPAPVYQTVVLAPLLNRIARLMGPDFAEAGIDFALTVEPKDLEVRADPDLLEQALINVLRNGAEALAGMAEGERGLSVTAGPSPHSTPFPGSFCGSSPRTESRSLTDPGSSPNGGIHIQIHDTGPGVPADQADRIFVPFFTTKEGGSGVGLSLTKQIMTAHGGGIDLSPGQDGGTIFTLWLP